MDKAPHEQLLQWTNWVNTLRERRCPGAVEIEKALRLAARDGFDAAVHWLGSRHPNTDA